MTVSFTQTLTPRLYASDTSSTSQGWVGYLLPAATLATPSEILLEAAFGSNLSDPKGLFFFSATTPPLTTQDECQTFVDQVSTLNLLTDRAFFWLTDLNNINSETSVQLGFDNNATQIMKGVEVSLITETLSFVIVSGCQLTLSSDNSFIVIDAEIDGKIEFTGSSQPVTSQIVRTKIPFLGPQSGCLVFNVDIERDSLYDNLHWGFQFLIPNSNNEDQQVIGTRYPFGDRNSPGPTDKLNFQVSIDPTDIMNNLSNDRTCFAFNDEETIINSYYRTNFGQLITLTPFIDPTTSDNHPKLMFALAPMTNSQGTEFLLSPQGDFTMSVDENLSKELVLDFACGLSGTETISFENGDRIRFVSNQAAYVPNFPFQPASPVGPPTDPNASLLDATFKTSWATIIRSKSTFSNHYNAQPKGSSLYGQDVLIYPQSEELLGFMSPGYELPQTIGFCFPMVPYSGVIPGDGITSLEAGTIEDIESHVLATTRRALIGQANTSSSPYASLFGIRADGLQNVTTPSGLIATVNIDSGIWEGICLAQNPPTKMEFKQPDPALQQAFQTNQLFLVVANAKKLGTIASSISNDSSQFFNKINIQDWIFEACIGQTNQYNDYNNVMIIKGKKGLLKDLFKNPSLWSQKSDFAIPSHLEAGVLEESQASELVILSQWLQDYIDQAAKETSQLFNNFNQIATNENWTGILIFKMSVSEFPDDLKALAGGIDKTNFNVHHFGIAISQIDGTTVTIQDTSSMFGLIYYLDDQYDPQNGEKPIAPLNGAIYDFKVLTLQVLFQNSAVKDFYSLSQLTMNQFFGQAVTRMQDPANTYNTILLNGSYQNQNGKGIYVLDALEDNSFYFDSPILNKVEIIKAQLTDVGDTQTTNSTLTTSRFSLWGFIDFKVIQEDDSTSPKLFDIFSFGNEAGKDDARQGLRYSGLGIDMIFSEDSTSDRTFTFDSSKIAFDILQSTPRPNSLYENFALHLDGFVTGNEESQPTDQNYLPVNTDIRLTGVSGKWYGLQFRLDMGTSGELIGKASLNASMLVAWSPNSDLSSPPAAMVGIKLPGTGGGAKLISLQGVMQLAIGNIRLIYIADQYSFLLLLTEIALKFLGLLKIPSNGSTSFYLFGNPNAGAAPDKLGWYAVYNQENSASLRMLTSSSSKGKLP